MYKIDYGADGCLSPFKIFQTLFSKATIGELHETKNNVSMLKTYNNLNIAQLNFHSKIKA